MQADLETDSREHVSGAELAVSHVLLARPGRNEDARKVPSSVCGLGTGGLTQEDNKLCGVCATVPSLEFLQSFSHHPSRTLQSGY